MIWDCLFILKTVTPKPIRKHGPGVLSAGRGDCRPPCNVSSPGTSVWAAAFLERVSSLPDHQPGDRSVEAEGSAVSLSVCRTSISPCALPGGSAWAGPHDRGGVSPRTEPLVFCKVPAPGGQDSAPASDTS